MVHTNSVPWIGNTSSLLVCIVPSILPRIKTCGHAVALTIAKNLTNDEGFYRKMSAYFLFWPNWMGENKGCKASWIRKYQRCFVLSHILDYSSPSWCQEGRKRNQSSILFPMEEQTILASFNTWDGSTKTRGCACCCRREIVMNESFAIKNVKWALHFYKRIDRLIHVNPQSLPQVIYWIRRQIIIRLTVVLPVLEQHWNIRVVIIADSTIAFAACVGSSSRCTREWRGMTSSVICDKGRGDLVAGILWRSDGFPAGSVACIRGHCHYSGTAYAIQLPVLLSSLSKELCVCGFACVPAASWYLE